MNGHGFFGSARRWFCFYWAQCPWRPRSRPRLPRRIIRRPGTSLSLRPHPTSGSTVISTKRPGRKRPCWRSFTSGPRVKISRPRSGPKCWSPTIRPKFISLSAASTPNRKKYAPTSWTATSWTPSSWTTMSVSCSTPSTTSAAPSSSASIPWGCRPMPTSANSKATRIFPGTPSGPRPGRSPTSATR